jgi:hypothetical protein
MQILTAATAGQWLEVQLDAGGSASIYGAVPADAGASEAQRVLSDCFRCNNLVVLTGLGTSLYVNVDPAKAVNGSRAPLDGKKIAPTMWRLWEKAREKSGAEFSKILTAVRFPVDQAEKGNIEALLSYCKLAIEFLGEGEDGKVVNSFVATTEAIIRDEVDFLSPTDAVPFHSELLRRIARRSTRKVRPKIFTTNYDLCFEHAARQGRYVVIDGFSHSSPQTFDSLYFGYDIVSRQGEGEAYEYIGNVVHLYKVHGSLDWERDASTGEILRRRGDKPLLIYPRNTKYELAFEQPYIEMMAAFQAALRQTNTGLLIVGYGFNDNHLSEPVLSAVRANLGLKVAICDPTLASKATENRFVKEIASLIKQGDARLSLIAGTFEDLVHYIPDIAAQTDLEAHLERVRLLRGSGNA